MDPKPRPDASEILVSLFADDRPLMVAVARFKSASVADAEDALADACESFLRHYSGPAGDQARNWLLKTLGRRARELKERRQWRERVLAGVVDLDMPPGPAEVVERMEELRGLTRVLRDLKPEEAEALILQGAGFSYLEIAGLKGWTRRQVERLLEDGRKKIASRLGGGKA